MDILILSWRGPGHPHAGGAESATHEHAKAWAKGGHAVTLFTSYFSGAEKNQTIDDVEIIRSGDTVLGVQVAAFFWYLFAKHKKFDLVVDQFHGIPFFTPLYVNCRKLAYIHETAKEIWKYNPWPKPFNLIPFFLGTKLEPFIFRFYRNIFFMTVSDSTKNDLIAWKIPKKNIKVIQNGVSISGMPKKLPTKEKKKTALYLGAISKDKGIFDAILAFNEINRKDDDWQFWVAGKSSEDMNNKIKSLINSLEIKNKIKLLGFVSDKKKFELFAKSHVLINPSVREGWGLVNIEANSVGTPVVGYKVPGMCDSVKDGNTGILVNFGDYRNLATSAIKLVGDKNLYPKFQVQCKKWAQKFSWEKSAKASLELIENI